MNTPSPSYSDSPRTSQTLSSRRRPSTTSRRNHSTKYHHHHQSIVSTSSISSKDSSNYASSRYPSGLTSMTGYTSVEVPSICTSPTTSTATSHYQQQQQQQHTYDAKQLTEDQFDIIDSLDYDDVDDALLGNASHQWRDITNSLTISIHARTCIQIMSLFIEIAKPWFSSCIIQNTPTSNHCSWLPIYFWIPCAKMPSKRRLVFLEWKRQLAPNENFGGYLAILTKSFKSNVTFWLALNNGTVFSRYACRISAKHNNWHARV